MIHHRPVWCDGVDPPGLEVILHDENHSVGENKVDVRAVVSRLPFILRNIFEFIDAERRRSHGMVAPILSVACSIAIGHRGNGLCMQKFKVVVLVEGIHVQFPAKIGEHLLGA